MGGGVAHPASVGIRDALLQERFCCKIAYGLFDDIVPP